MKGRVVRNLEAEFNSNLKDILYSIGKDYKSLRLLAESLGTSYQNLVYWIENYLGLDKDDFYPRFICKSPCLKLRVNGIFRYQLDRKIHLYCKCKSGTNVIVTRTPIHILRELCRQFGWTIARVGAYYEITPDKSRDV